MKTRNYPKNPQQEAGLTAMRFSNHFFLILLLLFIAGAAFGQCPTAPGDQTTYGSGSWIGYVYANFSSTSAPFSATYRGYVTESELFNRDYSSGGPSVSTVCGSYVDQFSIRYKMIRNFAAGYYTFTVGGDDGYRLSLDGGSTWAITNFVDHGYTTSNSSSIYLSGNTNLVLEYYENGGLSQVSFTYTACYGTSTAPTGISGTTATCSGGGTTLTATGGTLASGSVYQWGTGSTVGSNVISGETNVSTTVYPTATTTYWVRRVDPAICGGPTAGVTQAVTVTPISTAPTTIGGTTSICQGSSTTLTASGGTLATGSTYEWGTGTTVGSNTISGQNAASITVTPSTTTTYWVRRLNGSPCASATSGITQAVTVNPVSGDQISYGSGSWIGYVYANQTSTASPPTDAWTAPYRGYVTQSEVFDQNLGAGSISGANLCGTYSDHFSVRFKMQKTVTTGYYTFTVGGDDGYRFSLDGGSTWIIDRWYDQSYNTTTTASVYLSGLTNFIIEYYEQGGNSEVSFNYVSCTDFSSAPTSITGTTTICNGSNTTLTANGGYAAASSTYQWGTGATVGSSVIAGQTAASITVSPTTNTTYWVRRADVSPCTPYTSGVTQAVTVTPASTAPTTISGTTTICNGNSTTLTASGGTAQTGSAYQWGTGTVGSNIISGQTAAAITVNPTANTTYWVRRTDVAPCNTLTSGVTINVNVTSPSTAPTSISGSASLCYGSGGTTLAAVGGTAASGSTYQWGTGSVVGTSPIAGQTNISMYINPTATTTYWVRRLDAAPCSAYTTGVILTVNVATQSTAPTSITGTTTICAGNSTTLTASGGTLGTNGSYQWGTGYTAGTNPIAGQTGLTMTISPTVNTVYWVQRVDAAPCSSSTSGPSITVTVNNASTAPTSISGTTTICNGTSTTLTATGGTPGTSASYEWGTGTTVGTGTIAGQTSASITVNPTTNTPYWVRRVDTGVCAQTTAGVTQAVTVVVASTQPTGLTGTTAICIGSSTTLTATGGAISSGTGGAYQWGTGYTVGSNIIAGETLASITVSPLATTTYWVRIMDATPCSTPSWQGGQTLTVNVTTTTSTAPTSMTAGSTSLCYGSGGTTLYANGGTSASGGVFQWGTGTIGSNIISGQTNNSMYINPTATTTYWVRRVDPAPCNTITAGVTLTITVGTPSTAPTSITGTTTICPGSSTILTASGGTVGTGATYAWGTGYTVGSNTIAGQTAISITVSPTVNTVYWVRRVDPAPCNTQTGGPTVSVTIGTASTAPTSVTGTNSICSGSSTTLTASGGTAASGSTYEWGTGTVGTGTIAGQTSASITVSPTATTTYWVRRVDTTPCTGPTSGITYAVTVATASTAPTSITGTIAICSGSSTTLTASGGTLGTNGTYQWGTGLTVGTSPIAGQTSVTLTVSPTVATTYWVRRVDTAPCSVTTGGVTVNVTVNSASTAPTSVTGTNSICSGTSTTLTASGGTAGTGSAYEWGIGTVGSGTIAGQTAASITVSPTATTTYWVRRVDASPCSGSTSGITYAVTVATASTAPTSITGTTTICSGSGTTLTASGGTLGTNGSYQWGTGSTVGTGTIAGQTSVSITVNPTVNTTYWVRRSDAAPCTATTTGVTVGVTIATAPTAPTSITGTFTVCNGSGTTLTASGGSAGTNGVYEWGIGSTVGTGTIAGQTAVSITVSPTSTTTYWVRRVDATCGTSTAGVTQSVTVNSTVAGTLSSSTMTICKNTRPNPITLSGNTGSVVKWQYADNSAFTVNLTDIAVTSTTLASSDMGPIAATRYYRAVVQSGSCSVQNTTPICMTVPGAITYNGTWSGTPDQTTPVIISSNLTLASNLNVCSCQVNNSAVVTVPANKTLVVQGDITVDPSSNIVVESSGSLVQVQDTATDMGAITVKRKTTPMKTYDYTYWSSPVQGFTIGQLSPTSISYQFDPTINNWSATGSSTTMSATKGYIVRAPQGWSTTNATSGVYEAVFNGVPNSGVVSVPIIKNTGTYNLIGNPYPCAIDIDAFLLDAANTGIVNGTIYLWTHNTAISTATPGNTVYNYSRDDYAKYNITGGVKTASAAVSGGATPTGKVASGQGFFIEANTALSAGTYAATFRNSMRVIDNNSQFWRHASPETATPSTIEKHRVWLHITNTTGAYDEMLVGYVQGATNGFDNLYDGKTFPAGNVVGIYSILAADNLSIQGRALPFDQTDVIPVGFTSTIGGTFNIGLENFDGLFTNQDIYLVDKTDNSYHNLKLGDYTFTTATGAINTRFELRFAGQSLGIDQHTASANDVKIIKSGHAVSINAGNLTIASVSVFDLTGKLVYSKKEISAGTFTTADLNMATQVILVKVLMDNGETVTKKIIMN